MSTSKQAASVPPAAEQRRVALGPLNLMIGIFNRALPWWWFIVNYKFCRQFCPRTPQATVASAGRATRPSIPRGGQSDRNDATLNATGEGR